jgi:hypothetical protein
VFEIGKRHGRRPPFPIAHKNARESLGRFGSDFDEAVREPVEITTGSADGERAPEHFQQMLGGEQRIDDPVEARPGEGEGGFRVRSPDPFTSCPRLLVAACLESDWGRQ